MKVAIIGLHSSQETQVRDLFEDRFDLTFVSSSSGRISSAVDGADKVVVMTKFISHQAQDAVRKHPGLLYSNGGVSSLQRLLDGL
jgi:hypothetical protein